MATNTKKDYSEKDMCTSLLIDLKHLKAFFNTFTQEASNEALYKSVNSVYENISNLQRETFEIMCAQGWYKLSPDTATNLKKAYSKYDTSKAELSK